jgi:hypothetical protein
MSWPGGAGCFGIFVVGQFTVRRDARVRIKDRVSLWRMHPFRPGLVLNFPQFDRSGGRGQLPS